MIVIKDEEGIMAELSDDHLYQQELHLAKMNSLLDENTQCEVKFDMNIEQFQPQSPPLNIGTFEKMGNPGGTQLFFR